MKTENMGLPGSVAIIGIIYAVALAAAPRTGLSAQTDPTQTDQTALSESTTSLVVAGVATSLPDIPGATEPRKPIAHPRPSESMLTCPYPFGAEMSLTEFLQAHHPLPNRPTMTPGLSSPAWGKAKITVF